MDFATKFDRHFVVGFFAPALAFVAANLLLWPDVAGQSGASLGLQKAAPTIIAAGLVAILLAALNRHIIVLYEGYPLRWPLAFWTRRNQQRWHRRASELHTLREQYDALPPGSADAPRLRLEISRRWYRMSTTMPPRPDLILPTRLGNTIRAFERAVQERWNVEPIFLWSRLLGVIPAEFLGVIRGAHALFNFLISLTLLTQLFTVELLVAAMRQPCCLVAAGGTIVLSYAFYWAALGRAVEWGIAFNAAFDLYRRDLLRTLGTTPPTTVEEERKRWEQVAMLIAWNHDAGLRLDAQQASADHR